VRYLVATDANDPSGLPPFSAGFLREVVLPSLEALVRLESEGKILGGGVRVGERAITFIVEAESNRELDELLHDLPFWGISRMEVTPLQPIEERLEYERRLAERLA
jgi:muconolactone delta-isomerase